MLNSQPEISIVIPVKNGGPWLDDCLKAITGQTLFYKAEIIVIDSGSTDDSLSILEKYPVRLFKIPGHAYDHGLTRNYGVQLARGKFVVLTVQDARATDNLWLQRLMDGFAVADNVAGVCGQQIVPHEKDKNPVDWFRPSNAPSYHIVSYPSGEAYQQVSPEEKKNVCSWDNVTAAYRKDVLEKIPFQKMSYGEDAVWANDVLSMGYSLVYNSAAKVYHYHHENWDFMFKRALTVMYFRYKYFGFLYPRPKQSFKTFLSSIKTIFTAKGISFSQRWYWAQYNQKRVAAIKHAHAVFTQALKQGDEKLDEIHLHYCGKPPVPLKAQARNILQAV